MALAPQGIDDVARLKPLVISGVVSSVIGYGAGQLLRLGANLILTRLLFPEFFGLMGLVTVVVAGLDLFSDIGLETSIIRHERGDDRAFLDTAWTVQALRGVGLWLVGLIISQPLARFYGDPRLLWLIPIVAFGAVIRGFQSTSLVRLKRRMAVAHLTALELSSQAISTSVLVALACLNVSLWVLTLGYLTPALVKLVWSYWLGRNRPNHLAWEPAALAELFTFGRWIWFSTALTFLASQADRLMLAKLFSFELLGVYGIALALSEIPRALALTVASNVIYPGVSQLASLPREGLRRIVFSHRWPVLVGMAFGVAAMVGCGDLAIRLLYDERYGAAGWMLPMLAFGIWPNSLTQTIDSCLLAIGKPRYVVYGNVCRLVFTVAGIPLAYTELGAIGPILVVALNDLPFYGPVTYGLWREGLNPIGQDVKGTALFLGLLASVLAVRHWLGFGMPMIVTIDGVR